MNHKPMSNDYAVGKRAMVIPMCPVNVGIIVVLAAEIPPQGKIVYGGRPCYNGADVPSWVVRCEEQGKLKALIRETNKMIDADISVIPQNFLMLIEPDDDIVLSEEEKELCNEH